MSTFDQSEYLKSRTLKDDPQYFGVYLNMARNNIVNLNNQIAEAFGVELMCADGKIANCVLCQSESNSGQLLFEKARHFFPILQILEPDKSSGSDVLMVSEVVSGRFDLFSLFQTIFAEINLFRNDYTHYVFSNSRNSRKEVISPLLADFLEYSFKCAIARTKQRMGDTLFRQDFYSVEQRLLVLPRNGIITTIGLVFLTCMFLEREQAYSFIGRVAGLRESNRNEFIMTREVLMTFCIRLSQNGIITVGKRQSLIHSIASELRRCPNILFNVITSSGKRQFFPILGKAEKSDLTDDLSMIDFVTEFEGYERLAKPNIRSKNRFSEYVLRYIDEIGLLGNYHFQINLGSFVLTQYKKKFLGSNVPRKVVDHAMAFSKLKDIVNEDEVRNKIAHKVHGLVFEMFKPHYNIRNNKIAISPKLEYSTVFFNPNRDRKVAIKLRQPQPEAFISIHELPKLVLLDYLSKGKVEELIKNYVQSNRQKKLNIDFIKKVKSLLPGEDHWTIIERLPDNRSGSGNSDVQLATIFERKRVLNDVLKPYSLDDKQIPTRILDFWLNIQDSNINLLFSIRIRSMKSDCFQRLRAFDVYSKNYTGQIPCDIEMAYFLAKDIVSMVITESRKSRITSFYYKKLVDCILNYSDPEKRTLFFLIIASELRLLDLGGHPFLGRLDLHNISTTKDFYISYLQEKGCKMVNQMDSYTQRTKLVDQSWLFTTFFQRKWNESSGMYKLFVRYPKMDMDIPLKIRRWYKPHSALQSWLNKTSSSGSSNKPVKGVDLPTNLFDKVICELLRAKLNDLSVAYKPDANYNKLLKLWWNSCDDSAQSFYSLERQYYISGEVVKFHIGTRPNFKDYYSSALDAVFRRNVEERILEQQKGRVLPDIQLNDVEYPFKHTIAETEKKIRILQEQDQMMLLMLRQLMEDNQLKLRDADNGLLTFAPVKHPVSLKFHFTTQGEKINSKDQNRVIKRLIVTDRKSQSLWTFRKCLFDRRLPELLEYSSVNEDGEIGLFWIQRELRAYDLACVALFDLFFDLEKMIISFDKRGLLLLRDRHEVNSQQGYIMHHLYLVWLVNHDLINNRQFLFMRMVRNSFSHNLFPQRSIVESYLGSFSDQEIALQIADSYKNLVLQIDGILSNKYSKHAQR